MNYAIVGCGRVGKKRLAALPAGSKLALACDTNVSLAEEFVKLARAGRVAADFKQAVADPEVDAVIVATHNASLAEVSTAAIRAGKHVLVEKPGAVSVRQIDELIASVAGRGVFVHVGFNHRCHPAIRKAREIFESGEMGELMFIRARYGHGGRVGYDQEWRADPRLSGGGELLDQGVHLIDLASWFLGAFAKVEGHAATLYWKMPVDDNAFLSLRTAKGQTAWLHASCTEWKNLFSFEIYGRNAKLHIEGLGGSYGVERLYHYQMKPEMGPPVAKLYEFPGPDDSWQIELAQFEARVRQGHSPTGGLMEARAALQIVELIYRASGFPFGTEASEIGVESPREL